MIVRNGRGGDDPAQGNGDTGSNNATRDRHAGMDPLLITSYRRRRFTLLYIATRIVICLEK
jgi:hypothetical protein